MNAPWGAPNITRCRLSHQAFSNRWQGSATYTLSGLWNADTKPFSGLEQVTFATANDLGGEWGLSADDQRHRMVLNGIWQVGKGFQVSALHFTLAGIRLAHTYGGDVRGLGANFSQRLRPNGTIVPRNDLIAPAQNRTDLRFQQRIPLGGRVSIDAIAEVFKRSTARTGDARRAPPPVPAAHSAQSHGAIRLPPHF